MGNIAMRKNLRLGTRGSPLALVQARLVRDLLFSAHPDFQKSGGEIEIVTIRTSGDWLPEHQNRTFLDMGATKGLFTKEIEEALLAQNLDFAVHSMKDVAMDLPEGLDFAALLKREDPRDAFISLTAKTLDDLPQGARVGTSSLRRQAQILARRPDLKVIPLRGNVETRLKKLENGEAEATILAAAGLTRLGILNRATSLIDTQTMLPAAAQGAIGIEIRRDDAFIRDFLAPLNCAATMTCVTAERALLRVLDGSCRTPIAALAEILPTGGLKLDALAAKPDGTEIIRLQKASETIKPLELGAELGYGIKSKLPRDFLKG